MKRITLQLLMLLLGFNVYAQISVVSFSTGYSSPVDIRNCGDDRLFIVEQRGIIQICDTNGVKNPVPFLNIQSRVSFGGERGLLGLAFPPDFLTSGYFYVNYIENVNDDTRISRFHVDSLTPDSADPMSEEVLMTIYQPYSNHNGGWLDFGPDGYLYIGMGDGGSGGDPQNRSQNNDSLLGKMLRIAVDPANTTYSIPPTNPFAQDTSLGRAEIWATGLRNPWRCSFDRLNGDFWIADVGQVTLEEINMTPSGTPGGQNYGWRCYEGTQVYNNNPPCPPVQDLVFPVHEYNHNPGGYCSVSGGYRYRGAKYQEMYAKYFYMDYCVNRLQYLEDSNSTFVNTNLGLVGGSSITSFGEDRHGEIYCCGSGTVYKIVSADCTPVATINGGGDTLKDCNTGSVALSVPAGNGFEYIWMLNGDTVSTISSHLATQEGMYIVNVTNQSCSNSDSVFVDMIPPLNVSFSGLDTLYCSYDSPVNLSPNILGGTFSGQGISGATFSPAVAGIGTFTVTYNYTDADGCMWVYSSDVRVDACLDIPVILNSKNAKVYPNPASGQFSVAVNSSGDKKCKMTVTDITGSVVLERNFVLKQGENNLTFYADLNPGMYIVHLAEGHQAVQLKLVVE